MKYDNEKQAMDDLITELCCYMIEYKDFQGLDMVETIAEQFSIENYLIDKAFSKCESEG